MTETNDTDRDLDPDLERRLATVREASWWPIVILGVAVLVFWSAGFIPWFLQERDWPWKLHWGLKDAGVFGDSFGFINSLMSSLALVGVIAAIWLQKQELMEQRKELIITQWELKKSAEAQRDSQKELAKQAKINLQSTILTALQGLEQSAANPMLYPQDEAKSTALFIDGLRQRVIVAILTDDESGDLSQILSTQLNKWRDCTFTISVCRKFAGWSRKLLDAGADITTGQRRAKIKSEDINITEYYNLFVQLTNLLEKSTQAMRAVGISPEPLEQWVARSEEARIKGDRSLLIDQLNQLASFCAGAEHEASQARNQMFG